MIPSVRAVGSLGGNAGAFTVSAPVGRVAGDLLLLAVETCNQSLPGTPSGWSPVATTPGTGTAGTDPATMLSVFSRWADGTANDDAAVGDSGNHQVGVIIACQNVGSTSPIHQTSVGTKATPGQGFSVAGVTTTIADCLILYIVSHDIDSAVEQFDTFADASLGSITQHVDDGSTVGNGGGICIVSGTKAVAGATGTLTANSSTATNSVNAFMCVALGPIVSSPSSSLSPSPSASRSSSPSASISPSPSASLSPSASPSPSPEFGWVMRVAGIVRPFRMRTLKVSEVVNGRNTLTCEFVSTDSSFRPAINAVLSLRYDGVTKFEGLIVSARESGVVENGKVSSGIATTVTAQSYAALAARRYMKAIIPRDSSVQEALAYVLPYLTGFGVAAHGSQSAGPTLPEMRYEEYTRVDKVLDDIAAAATSTGTPWVWDIDYDKKLRAWTPSEKAAPFNLASGDPNTIGDIVVEPNTDDYCNRLIVLYQWKATESAARFVCTANFSDLSTITIDGQVYTLQDDAPIIDLPGRVMIGPTTRDTLTNLANAISGGAGRGSDYAASTPVHPTCTAVVDADDALTVKALVPGAEANTIPLSSTAANGSWKDYAGNATATLAYGQSEGVESAVLVESLSEQATMGVWEDVIEAQNVFTPDDARALGTAALDIRMDRSGELSYDTLRAGIEPGMQQTVTLSERNLSGTYSVTAVETTNREANILVRTVKLTKGASALTSWRDLFKTWSSAGTTSAKTPSSSGSGSPTQQEATSLPVFFLGGSGVELVQSNSGPTWVDASPMQVRVTCVGPRTGRVTCRVRALEAAISVTPRLHNVTTGDSAGTGSLITSTAWTTVEFDVALNDGTCTYKLVLLPGAVDKDVAGIGYLEVLS